MKVSITMRELKDAIKKVKKLLSENTTVDVLKNLLVSTEGNSVKLSAYDLQDYVEIKSETGIVHEPGKMLIDKYMLQIIEKVKDKIPSDHVAITQDSISFGNKKIDFELSDSELYLVEEYPDSVECDVYAFTIQAQELVKLLNVSYVCDRKGEIRPFTQSVCIDNDYLVATDTYRIARRKFEHENNIGKQVLIHFKSVDMLQSLLKKVDADVVCHINKDKTYINFEFGNIKHTAYLLNEKFYADWRDRIYPEEFKTTVVIDKQKAIEEIGLLRTFVIKKEKPAFGQSNDPIRFSIKNGNMTIMGSISGKTMTVDIPIEQKGDDLDSIYLNSTFLLEMLKQQDEKMISINFAGGNRGAVVIGNDDLVLPIKMDK